MSTTAKTAPTTDNVVVEQPANDVQQASNAVGYQNTIKKLLASGAKRINSIRIKNVNFTNKDNYTMISFTLAAAVKGFVTDDEGASYKEGTTHTVFTSLFAIVGAMKEDEELGWMANTVLEKPEILNLLLNGSVVDILQQEVSAGEEYVNPFSTKADSEPRVYEHNVIISNIISFKLGTIGKQMSNRLADKLMGF